MSTRFVRILMPLFLLAVALASPACKFVTAPHTGLGVTSQLGTGGSGGSDSTGTGGTPPAPPSGISIGVSDDSTATAGHQGFLELFAVNQDSTTVTVNYKFTGPQGWPGFPATGTLTVPLMKSATADVPVSVPAETTPGVYLFHYEVRKSDGVLLQSGDFGMTVHPS